MSPLEEFLVKQGKYSTTCKTSVISKVLILKKLATRLCPGEKAPSTTTTAEKESIKSL